MRLLRAAFVMLPLIAACGDDEQNGSGDVAAVFPESGFIGRTTRVAVVGDGASWDASTTLNFGDGVTVSNIEVASSSAIFADITVAPGTPAGALDITVTDSGDTSTLPAAFTIASPIEIETIDFEQGGFGAIRITNLDLLNPFDDSLDPDTFDFIGVTVASTDPAVTLTLSDVTFDTITLSAAIDVDATTTGAITITSTTEGVDTVTQADPVAVTARAPIAITPGTDANFTMAANGNLFEFTAAEAGLLNLRVTTADTALALSPGFIIVPASGKLSEAAFAHQNFGDTNLDAAIMNQVVAPGDTFYLIALESPFGGFFVGSPGYAATLSAKTISLTGVTAVADTGDNGAPNTAQALTGTVARFDGSLTTTADVDCFKIPMAANKAVHVYTTDDDTNTDSSVEVFESDAADADSLGVSSDADFGEDFVTDVQVAADTRSICVRASEFAPKDLENAAYTAIVVVE